MAATQHETAAAMATHDLQRRLHQAVQMLCVLLEHLLQVLEQVSLKGVCQVVAMNVGVLQHLPALDDLLRRLCTHSHPIAPHHGNELARAHCTPQAFPGRHAPRMKVTSDSL